MKTCKNCFREINDDDNDRHDPVVELGNIFVEHIADLDPLDYCRECREELGLLNVAGFST